MVKKIKRRGKSAKDSFVGVPVVLLSAAVFGPKLESRRLPGPWETPGRLADLFSDHFDLRITVGDRPLGPHAFRAWLNRVRWEDLGPHAWPGGAFPLTVPDEEPRTEDTPSLGCVPILIATTRRRVDFAVERASSPWTDIQETAFERWAHDAFNLIPGYDRILHAPLAPLAAANRALDGVNARVRDTFDRAGLPPPRPFPPFPPEILSRVPGTVSLVEPSAID